MKNPNSIYLNGVSGFGNRKYIPVRRHCKCGHTVEFLRRIPKICSYCKHYVYPDDKYEFEEKLKKEIRKNEQSNI